MNSESRPLTQHNYQLLFDACPHPYLIFLPNQAFTIAAVNERYLAITGTQREIITGRGVLEVFPDIPDDPSGSGAGALLASLHRVLSDRRQHIMGVQKYVTPLSDGGLDVKFLRPVNTPISGPEGNIAYITHHIEEVTECVFNQECTERQREGQMKAEALHLSLDVAHAGAWEWDLLTHKKIWPVNTWILYGLEPNSCEPCYETWIQTIHPDDRSRAVSVVEEALAAGTEFEVEWRVNVSGTPQRWLMSRGRPWRNADGRITRYIGIGIDITERKQVELSQHESEAQFRAMFELASVGITQTESSTGRFLRVNRRYCAITGYSEDELIGRPFTDITHPEDRERDWELFASAVRGDSADYRNEKRYLRKDGRVVWVNVNAATIRNCAGQPVRTIAIIEDISTRKQTEYLAKESIEKLSHAYDLLRESQLQNQYLANILRQSDQPFAIGYPDGSIGYANNAFERLTGCSPDDLLTLNWKTTITPTEWQEFEQAKFEKRLLSGQPIRYQKEFFRKDHTGVPIELLVSAAVDQSGQPLYYYAFITDLTERKKAEAALREAAQRKDEFLAMLAHELRNPLAPIRNAAHVLGLLENEDPRLRWAQDIIERQVTHLTRMVDDLLDVSRIVRGKISLKKQRLNLADMLHQVLETAGSLMIAKRQHFKVNLPVQPIILKADPVRLAQVLLNLLDNAKKFSREDGRIDIDVHLSGTDVVIKVRDYGSGIQEKLLPYVFDLFQQGERTQDRPQGGLGIGLTLVKRLVEMHGGRVTATSPGEGLGATFSIRLPTLSNVNAIAEPDSSPPPQPKTGMRVLVVDDDSDVRESTTLLLELQGHEVRMADSGERALTLIETFHPDIVLLDIGLPGDDGFEVARQIRELPSGKELLLVALSGYGQVENMARSRGARFDHYLIKPMHFDALDELLSNR